MKTIEPIKINYGGPSTVDNSVEAINLLVNITGDNLIDTCYLYFELQDINNNNIFFGNLSITDDNYKNWSGDNNYPYEYVASIYSLTFIN